MKYFIRVTYPTSYMGNVYPAHPPGSNICGPPSGPEALFVFGEDKHGYQLTDLPARAKLYHHRNDADNAISRFKSKVGWKVDGKPKLESVPETKLPKEAI